MMRFLAVLLVHGLAFAAAGPALAQAVAGGAEQGDYRLGPDDVLEIQVWQRPELTGAATVDPTGRLRLPLVGEVEVKGRTLAELTPLLTERYRLLDPSIVEVVVAVAQYNSRSVTVVGEVRAPGRYGFRSIPDLWSVILNAGGATPEADLARVQIIRDEAEGDGQRTVTADLSRGVEHADKEPPPSLRPKDTVLVPSLVGSVVTGDRFQVLGAVRAPGTYRLSAAASVVEAISASGGGLPNADLSRVRLTRPTERGAVAYRLDLQSYLDSARPAADIELRAGDTITVPGRRSTWDELMGGVGRFAPLLSVAVSLILLSR
ncbi:MAG: polysaccharide export protein [Candidatus Eisenbacteria bacterium]|uniref:Polysaccharide export protein n=1 Tax=Eiseniibacteriota bacterium TaxID=2212470 RepID=A0A938BQ96_UNCEI|nr:polysaccharide export protein [Candidatus Eisenbacteria bacterium]